VNWENIEEKQKRLRSKQQKRKDRTQNKEEMKWIWQKQQGDDRKWYQLVDDMDKNGLGLVTPYKRRQGGEYVEDDYRPTCNEANSKTKSEDKQAASRRIGVRKEGSRGQRDSWTGIGKAKQDADDGGLLVWV
jgi:hypothetical protein